MDTPDSEIQERSVGSSRPRKMYSMMATTNGMLARKQMMVSTGTYCRPRAVGIGGLARLPTVPGTRLTGVI
jgi:hypothetical protein